MLAGTYTVTSSGNVTIDTLSSIPTATLSITGGTFAVTNFTGQGPLALSGGTFNIGNSTATVASLAQSGGTLTGTGTLTVGTASFTSGGGTESGTGTGKTVVQGAATFNTGGNNMNMTIDARTLQLQGATSIIGSGGFINLNNAAQLVITSTGTVNDQSNGLAINTNTLATSLINNQGTWTRNNNGLGGGSSNLTTATTINVAFNNSGTVDVEAGTVKLAGGGTDSAGSSYIGSGTIEFGQTGGAVTHAVNGSINAGNVTFSGGTNTVSGSYSVSGTTTVAGGSSTLSGTVGGLGALAISAGTLDLSGTSPTGTSLAQSGGTLKGTGTLTVGTASFTSGGGTESGTGTGKTVVQGAATFNTGGNNMNMTIDARTLQLQGATSIIGSGGFINLNNAAQLVITSTGTVNDQSNGLAINTNTLATSLINNQGTWTRNNNGLGGGSSNLTTATTINVAFNNSGTVDVEAGTVKLAGGGTDSAGSSYIGSGTIEFGQTGGAVTHAVNGSINAGNVTFSGGTNTVSGSYSVSGTTTVAGGSSTLSGTVGGLGALAISAGTLDLSGTSPTGTSLAQSGGTLKGTGTLTVGTASFTSGGGTESGTGTGKTVVQGAATFNTGGNNMNMTIDARTLQLQGATSIIGSGGFINLNNAAQLVITSTGTVNDQSNGLAINTNTLATSLINNQGTWTRNNNGLGGGSSNLTTATTINVAFNNSGTVDVEAGTVKLAGGGTDSAGSSYIGSGTIEFGQTGGAVTHAVNGSINAGNVTFSGGTNTVSGSYSVSGTTTVTGGSSTLSGTVGGLGALAISAGTLDLSGTSPTGTSLAQSGGTLKGTGTLTVGTASFTSGGGTESGTGTGKTVVQGAATFNTGGNNMNMTIDARTLQLQGATSIIGSGGFINLNNAAQLVITSTGTVNDQSNGLAINTNTAATPGIITNQGTWTKTTGTLTTIGANVAFNNSGTVDVKAGTLIFGGVVNSQGGHALIEGSGTLEYKVASNENVAFGTGSGGILRLDASQFFTPQSTVSVAGFRASETLDLTDINFVSGGATTATYSNTTGILSVTNGTKTAQIALVGPYQNSAFSVVNTAGHTDVTVEAAPVLNNIAAGDYFTGSASPVLLAPALDVIDLDSANLTGATVTISGFQSGDTLTVGGGAPNTITYSYNSSNGTLTLSGVASLADYQAALRLIEFSTTAGGTTRAISWTVNDGTVSSVTGTATLSLTTNTPHVWGTTSVPEPTTAGAHFYPPFEVVNSSQGFIGALYGVTPSNFNSAGPDSINLYMVGLDPFFLPENTATPVLINSTIQKFPITYTFAVPNISATNAEGIGFYETQDSSGNSFLNEVFVTGHDNILNVSAPTLVAGPLSSITENPISLQLRQDSNGILSSYALEYDQYSQASGTYTINLDVFNHTGSAFDSASDFTQFIASDIPSFTGLTGGRTTLPASFFIGSGANNPYLLGFSENFSPHSGQDYIEFWAYDTSGNRLQNFAQNNTSNFFEIAPNLSAYGEHIVPTGTPGAPADPTVHNQIRLEPNDGTNTGRPSSLFFLNPAGANGPLYVAWNEAVTVDGDPHTYDQVEFVRHAASLSPVNQYFTYQIPDGQAQSVKLQAHNISTGSLVFLAYGDSLSTTVKEFSFNSSTNTTTEISSYTEATPNGQTYDNLRDLGDGRVAIVYDDQVDISGTTQTSTHIVDFRTAGLNISFNFTGSISGNTLTVTLGAPGTAIALGETIIGSGILPNTTITSFGTGTGGTGTYILSNSQTIAGEPMSLNGGNDKFFAGTQFNDVVNGAGFANNEYYYIGSGSGSVPSDIFNGGANGQNVAIFPDAITNYTITPQGGGSIKFTNNGTQHAGSLTVSGVQALAFGPSKDPLEFGGLLEASAGTLYIASPLNTPVVIDVGAAVEFNAANNGSTAVSTTFLDTGGTLKLDTPASFTGKIILDARVNGTSSVDTLDLANTTGITSATIAGNTLTTNTGLTFTVIGARPGALAASNIHSDGAGGIDLDLTPVGALWGTFAFPAQPTSGTHLYAPQVSSATFPGANFNLLTTLYAQTTAGYTDSGPDAVTTSIFSLDPFLLPYRNGSQQIAPSTTISNFPDHQQQMLLVNLGAGQTEGLGFYITEDANGHRHQPGDGHPRRQRTQRSAHHQRISADHKRADRQRSVLYSECHQRSHN